MERVLNETSLEATQVASISNLFSKVFLWDVLQALEDVFRTQPSVVKPVQFVRKAIVLEMGNTSGKTELSNIFSELNASLRALHYALKLVTAMSPAYWVRGIRFKKVCMFLSKRLHG